MDYRFTAILIILLSLMAVFGKPGNQSYNIDKDERIIIPLPKPKQ
tara:strand:- start:49 stop:183 length:135 start_codon:yes stop_codon:yes gene_type:complete